MGGSLLLGGSLLSGGSLLLGGRYYRNFTVYLEGLIFGILQYDNFCIIYYVKLQFTVWSRYRTPFFSHSTIGRGEPDTLQTKS